MSDQDFKVKKYLESVLEALKSNLKDAERFDSGSSAAGTRLRKSLAVLRASMQETRFEIQKIKNAKKQPSEVNSK